MKSGVWVDLGRAEYAATWELQKQVVARRQRGEVPDALLLVEHPDVVTVGRAAKAMENVLSTEMPLFAIERGGDATYHGPGQLVGYPIVHLDEDERDLHAYLRALEAALIATCASVGLVGERRPGFTGVWIGARKVASLGVAVRRWVTLHGFALNVATDLSRFAAIHPCGLDAAVMTSLSVAAARPIAIAEIQPHVVRHLGAALGRNFQLADPSAIGEPAVR